MHTNDFDVLIVGGGLVGLSLAKGLEDLNISYRLLDDSLVLNPDTLYPPRALALSKTSLAILDYLGIYQEIVEKTCAIRKIQVSSEKEKGQIVLENPEHDFLGKVVNLNDLQSVMREKIQNTSYLISGQFKSYCPDTKAVTATIAEQEQVLKPKIIIAADGAQSSVRQMLGLPLELALEQTVLLSFIHLKAPHLGHAYERFTQAGPLALLPWQEKQMAMVWALPKEFIDKQGLTQEEVLLNALHQQLGGEIGEIQGLDFVKVYPLQQSFMPKQMYQNILFLGNAAHSLHPVAGQGFNLSLRDVAILLDTFARFGLTVESFPIYLVQRYQDQRLTQGVTRFLATGLSKMKRFIPGACGFGMSVLNQIPSFKNVLAFYAQGLGYPLPKWVYQHLDVINE